MVSYFFRPRFLDRRSANRSRVASRQLWDLFSTPANGTNAPAPRITALNAEELSCNGSTDEVDAMHSVDEAEVHCTLHGKTVVMICRCTAK